MKSILFVALFIYAIDNIFGVSVVIKDHKVYVDEKPVDLSKLEVIKDMPHATSYILHSGNTNITITKSKFGDAIAVSSTSKMTPEEAAKAKEFHKKLTQKIEEKVKNIQKDVDQQIKAIQEKIKSAFSFQPLFPFF